MARTRSRSTSGGQTQRPRPAGRVAGGLRRQPKGNRLPSGSVLEVWQQYISMEMEMGNIHEARSLYKRYYSKTFAGSASEDICHAWIKFEQENDTLDLAVKKENNTALADFNPVWKAKKFSYLYEGRPKINSDFFMQSLFLHCIGHLTSQSSLHRRLARLYCLYYECRQLKGFVITANQKWSASRAGACQKDAG